MGTHGRSSTQEEKILGRHALDLQNMYGSIAGIPKQMVDTLEDLQFDALSVNDFSAIRRVVIVGMGSSLVAFRLLESLYGASFSLPVTTVNGRELPSFVDSTTLIVFSSYSGGSSEILACVRQALRAKALLFAVSAGEGLFTTLGERATFTYKYNPLHNPCGQPRTAVGYSLAAFVQIITRLGITKNVRDTWLDAALEVEKLTQKNEILRASWEIATRLQNRYVDVVAEAHLTGNAELFAKQLAWNAKQAASFMALPEALHVIPEGIYHPEDQQTGRHLVLLSSNLTPAQNKHYTHVVESYMKLHKMPTFTVRPPRHSVEFDVLYTMLLGSFVSYFLAGIYGLNPTPTPGIEFYKRM